MSRDFGIRRAHCALLALVTTVAPAALYAQSRVVPVAEKRDTLSASTALQVFASLSAREQERVLGIVRESVGGPESSFPEAVAELAERGRVGGEPRYKPFRVRGISGPSGRIDLSAVGARSPITMRFAYRFGIGVVEPAIAGQRQSRSARAAAERSRELKALLAGDPVGLDLAMAEILRHLDRDRRVDTFAVFLECWRNGDESFYRALERTAGTSEGVFHFDAMFDDWLRRCVPAKHPDRKRLQRSHNDTHAAFHQAFRNYWRYRSLREMIALTLLLPPDVALPSNLQRFERNGGDGGYSTRDTVWLMLAANGGDITATLDEILEHAPQLPEDLWASDYSPYEGLANAFEAMMPRMFERAAHTDDLLASTRKERSKQRDRMGAVALAALCEALPERAVRRASRRR